MSRVKNISLAEQALGAIQDSEFVQSLQATRRISELGLVPTISPEQSFNDRDETINDYMFNCGYTRKQAINAYNKTLEEDER